MGFEIMYRQCSHAEKKFEYAIQICDETYHGDDAIKQQR